MIARRWIIAAAILCLGLFFGVQEFDESDVINSTGVVLRKIESKTGVPVANIVQKITGIDLIPKASPPESDIRQLIINSENQGVIPEALPDQPIQPVESAPAEENSVTLKDIRFNGIHALNEAELNPVVARYLGRSLKYDDLMEIAAAVESYYRRKNYIARVSLQPQDLNGGVLTLDVIESVLSDVEVEDALIELPSTQEHALALLQAQQAKGKLLNTKDADRGVALINQIPGVSATAALQEGQNYSETELILKLYANKSRQQEVMLDNYGSFGTGPARVTASMSIFNPADMADLLQLTAVMTKGSDYVRAAYSWAVGNDGWRMGVNLSDMTYQVINGMVGVVGATGQAISQGLEWTYPLLLDESHKSTVALTVDDKHFVNTSAQSVEMSNYKVDVAGAEVKGVMQDLQPGGSLKTYSVQMSEGHVNLNGSLSQLSDTAKTEGNYAKLKLNATILKPLTTETSLFGAVTVQRSSKNLDSSEKMSLGGVTGVRAYPTGEGTGSEGEIINLEVRHHLNESTEATLFYDWGQIHQMQDPNFPGSPALNSYTLKGFGASVGYTTPSGMQIKGTWARRIGSNPNPTQTGMDQDGTYDRNRFWVQLMVPF